ncbi:L,D-transpeptidase family protein [Clostridium sp. LP20]|uniref:L,D-transpeptidase family protein n=1 Tax=Clostridium sp. LP20 TaxID=3418665 RepID=UPI003EE78546
MKKYILFLFALIFFNTLSFVRVEGSSNKPLEKKDYIIFIDVNELTLSLIDKKTKKSEKIYPIAIGKKETPSPLGQWKITSKALKEGPFGGYWLGLNAPWDTFGIHGTSNPSSIGSLASNGCIRMYNYNIKEVFYLVDYDTEVIIQGGPTWRFSPYVRIIKPKDKGTDVFYVQKALKDLGYYTGVIDGIYGYPLEIAVTQYREEHNLSGDSKIDEIFLNSIGLPKFE